MNDLDGVYRYASQVNREGIILDTVVLLLFFVGKMDLRYIEKFPPTHTYSKSDFEILLKITKPFKKIIITPQIIAELSNQVKQSIDNKKLHYYLNAVYSFLNDKQQSEEFHLKFEKWKEKSVEKLCSFGFVDLSMYEIALFKKVPIVTDDIKFYNYSERKIPIIKLSVIKNSSIFN